MRLPPAAFAPMALALVALAAVPSFAVADSLIKLKGQGTLSLHDGGPAVLELAGTSTHLGKFTCYGEITFAPGEEEGSLDGFGIVAFMAANGDVLVGEMTWHTDADGTGQTEFHWHDAVTFNDGTTVESSGHFAHQRPPGASVKVTIT